MKLNIARIPLAIALTSALAFSVGCANDNAADDAAMTNDPAVTAPPADTSADMTPATDTPTTGAMDASAGPGDGRDSDQPVDDTWITTKVKSSLLADTDVAGLDINVDTLNGVVTLSGQVDEDTQIAEAVRITREIEGVTDVVTTGLTMAPAAN
ncbi:MULTISPECIES: BON domain-containing protein [Luteimonas]|uniref:BON domain-containing protein n=1 Tax=Luteimonas TaxID=83614 RepID=UPI001E3EC8B7|nr:MULTISPECIES: BON domain-containing protein [Luteimonas]